MRVPEPLRNSPFRMYRRKSLYTGLYGTNYSGPTRPPGDITESSGVPIQSRPNPSHKIYMSGFFDEYAPHPGPMQTLRKDYKFYDASVLQNLPQSVRPTVPDGFLIGGLPFEEMENANPTELQTHLIDEQFNGPALKP